MTSENNQLHGELILEAERFDRLQKDSYQAVKRLEDKVAELTFWQQQARHR